MLNAPAAARRALPSVDRLLQHPDTVALIAGYGRPLVLEAVRAGLEALRRVPPATAAPAFDEAQFIAECAHRLERDSRPSLRSVFNLTGTVLHTNLGRAVMPRCAAEAVMRAMTEPVNLEYDIDGAGRGERDAHVEGLLTRLTGAEAALVVNNNAAAVYLTLNGLATRREVLVSRGELVEIGGSFRIPDIMARAGCKLVEVGTTNRTHLKDYADAITERTAAVMKVHTSNYAIQGFTATVPEEDLAALCRERGIPFIDDLGSGMLIDLERYGLPHEPTPQEALAHGADLVTFSGDKLLGGPQAGLVVGKRELVARLKKNPMKRALRVDKMTLAALEAVLRLYLNPDRLHEELPTIAALSRPTADIAEQAQRLLPVLQQALSANYAVAIADCSSQIGSGSLPVDLLPSKALSVTVAGKRRGAQAERIAKAFRALPVPVIGRISDGAFLLDLRCMTDEAGFAAQLKHLKLQ